MVRIVTAQGARPSARPIVRAAKRTSCYVNKAGVPADSPTDPDAVKITLEIKMLAAMANNYFLFSGKPLKVNT
jgi:hypothetical protein